MDLGGRVAIGHNNISEFGGDVDILRGDVYDNYIHSEQAFGSEGYQDVIRCPIQYLTGVTIIAMHSE